MALTVGIIRELFYISLVLKREVYVTFHLNNPLDINIQNGFLNLKYKDIKIWRENLSGADSNFGIESCDQISRIINCIDANDENYKKYIHVSDFYSTIS